MTTQGPSRSSASIPFRSSPQPTEAKPGAPVTATQPDSAVQPSTSRPRAQSEDKTDRYRTSEQPEASTPKKGSEPQGKSEFFEKLSQAPSGLTEGLQALAQKLATFQDAQKAAGIDKKTTEKSTAVEMAANLQDQNFEFTALRMKGGVDALAYPAQHGEPAMVALAMRPGEVPRFSGQFDEQGQLIGLQIDFHGPEGMRSALIQRDPAGNYSVLANDTDPQNLNSPHWEQVDLKTKEFPDLHFLDRGKGYSDITNFPDLIGLPPEVINKVKIPDGIKPGGGMFTFNGEEIQLTFP